MELSKQEVDKQNPHPFEAHELYPGKLQGYERFGNYVEISSSNHVLLRIYVLEKNIVRFRYSTNGRWEDDFSYAIDPVYQSGNPDFEIHLLEESLFIKTPSITIQISRENLGITILNNENQIVCEDEKGFHWEEYEKYGGNIVQVSKKAKQGEAFYGLGDKPTIMNLRSHRFQNWGMDEYGYNTDTDPLYKNINFFYGLHDDLAYGIFLDNSFKSFFDFASERKTVTSFWSDGGEMNYYFIYGPELMEVAKSYTLLTGTAEMPPLWSLGYQQCKWSYSPDTEVMEIASKMRELEIPCDAIYLDIDYMDGFRCFTWDPEKFPQPKRLVSDLQQMGFNTMVIIDPGIKIDREYDIFKEGFEKDYFCKRADGPYAKGKVWPGDCYFPDFTNPEVRDWWSGLFKELIEDIGVAGIWNDMNEPALFEVESKTMPLDVRHDYDGHPCSHRKAHNIYGMQMARATADGIKRFNGGKRSLVITRSGYNGLQRFSSVWTGDNLATWDHLLIAHQQTQRLSISGISFVGSDIGGFIGQPSGELFVRWVQMAVFHPFFRTHSSGDHGDQEPWSFGEDYLHYVRKFINLRYQLLPYIYTTFYQYHRFGMPMLRPVTFVEQADDHTMANRYMECFLGDHIMYCPVVQPGVKGKIVYIPEGNYYNYFDNSLVKGKQDIYVDSGLDKMPMFIKEGAVIPHYPVMQYVGEKNVDTIELRVYYKNGEETSFLYVDDNSTMEYKDGSFSVIEIALEGTESSLRLKFKMTGSFKPGFHNYHIKLIGCPFDLNEVKLDESDDGQAGVQRIPDNGFIINSEVSTIEFRS